MRGVNGGPIRPDAPIPMVGTKDIANAAARLPGFGTFAGHSVRYLLGPRDVTLADATRIPGEAIGKPGPMYEQLPEWEAREAMTGMRMSASAVDAMVEMQRGFNAGRIRPTRDRDAEGATPTTPEELAGSVFARAYKAAA